MKFEKIVLIFCLLILSVYPVYRNYYYGLAIHQYERHVDFLNVDMQFHNPWQYRILSPLTAELLKRIYDNTIDKIVPIEKFQLKKPEGFNPKDKTSEILDNISNPDYVKYNMIYSFLRVFINLLIFIYLFRFLSCFTKNKWLVYLMILFTALLLGNAVNDSDFALHTYVDIILYLCVGIIILSKKNDFMIIILSCIGALNRETSLLIPFLYFMSHVDWNGFKKLSLSLLPSRSVIIITSVSSALSIAILIAIRLYYGYESQTQWKVPAGLPMLKLNLLSLSSVKTYFEMLGVFSVLPIICLFYIKRCIPILKVWFWSIVPIWFIVHLVLVVAYQGRLFLVPTLLIFLPIMVEIIDKEYHKSSKEKLNE